jgi:hypothetical protein
VKTGEVLSPRQPPWDEARKKTWSYLSYGRSALGRAAARVLASIS